jgi:hypothetical protein
MTASTTAWSAGAVNMAVICFFAITNYTTATYRDNFIKVKAKP